MTLRLSKLAPAVLVTLTAIAALSTGCKETDHSNFKGGPASTTNTPTAVTNAGDLMVKANTQPGTAGPSGVTGAMALVNGHVEDIAGDAGKGAVHHGDHGGGGHGDGGGHGPGSPASPGGPGEHPTPGGMHGDHGH